MSLQSKGKFVFNPSKKKKGLKTKPDLTLQDIDSFYESPQSKGSTTPPQAIKKLSIIGLGHISDLTFKAVIYTDTLAEENNLQILPDGDFNYDNFDPNIHQFESHILTAKAHVTPLKTGLTIPRSEVSGLLLCSRLMAKAVTL